ncbi:hypothetical protein C8Q72DRAFT_631443 [Fomitopsis betulina]|nr:hypothetical protein C8Q72DRAFT_631443 [Fomitopsis betulina]
MHVPLATFLMRALITSFVGAQLTTGFPFVSDFTREAADVSSADPGATWTSDTPAAFWKHALSLGKPVQTYASFLFRNATEGAETIVAMQINNVSDTVHDIVLDTEKLKKRLEHIHGASFDDIREGVSQRFTDLLQELKEQFPPPVQAPNHAERVSNVSLVLQKVEAVFVSLCIQHGVSEQPLKSHLDPLLEHIKEVVVMLGDVAAQHPELFETLVIAGIMLIIPESWFLRPLFMVFGMSPEGPVEGSIVAWAQGRFYGAYVPKGSWFSLLQRAGMTMGRRWPSSIGKIFGWALAVVLFGLASGFTVFRFCVCCA